MKREHERFEEDCMEKLARCRVILDVGGGSRFQKGMKKFETRFKDCDYRTLDVSADYGPDIVGDIHAIPLPDASVDGVVCRSVLEHVADPAKAVGEMHRILKPGGLLFIQVPSIYPYHARTGHGAYPDYWRFFESTIRLICRDFQKVTVQRHGGWFHAVSRFFPFQAKLRWILDPVVLSLDGLIRTRNQNTTSFYSVFLEK